MMKIKASLTNNVGIKVIAVVIAALIWLMIVNISAVSYTHLDVYKRQGKMPESP